MLNSSKPCKKKNLINPHTGKRTNNKNIGISATKYYNIMIQRAAVFNNLMKHGFSPRTANRESVNSFPFPLPNSK